MIPNGVDLEAWPEASGEERSRRPRAGSALDERPTVVCVGRLSRQKGQDVLLEAWPAILAGVPEAQLVLVGDGPDEESLRSSAGPRVRLVGKRADVADWLAAADVVAFPSRWEGMSLGMLEAMASGRSVVASDVGGAQEALGGEAGAVVPPGGRRRACERDRRSPARSGTDGRRGSRRPRARRGSHDLRTSTAALAALYEELLAARLVVVRDGRLFEAVRDDAHQRRLKRLDRDHGLAHRPLERSARDDEQDPLRHRRHRASVVGRQERRRVDEDEVEALPGLVDAPR